MLHYVPGITMALVKDRIVKAQAGGQSPRSPALPIGHPYSYAGNDPVNGRDPAGLHMVPDPYRRGMYWHGAWMGSPLHTHPSGDARVWTMEDEIRSQARERALGEVCRAAFPGPLCTTICASITGGGIWNPLYWLCYGICRATVPLLRP